MISKNKTRQVCCFSACNQHNPNFEMKARAPLKDEKVNWIHVLQKKNIACRMVQCVTGAFNFRNSSFSPYEIYTHFRDSRVSEPKCFLYSLKIVLYDRMFCYLRVKVLKHECEYIVLSLYSSLVRVVPEERWILRYKQKQLPTS